MPLKNHRWRLLACQQWKPQRGCCNSSRLITTGHHFLIRRRQNNDKVFCLKPGELRLTTGQQHTSGALLASAELLLTGSAGSQESDLSVLNMTGRRPPLSKRFLWGLYHMDTWNKPDRSGKRSIWCVGSRGKCTLVNSRMTTAPGQTAADVP